MLKSLRIENFRGFDRHSLTFKKLTIIVGQNNAGKSTIVEALRLLSIVVSRYRYLTYHSAPEWTQLPKVDYVISPAVAYGMVYIGSEDGNIYALDAATGDSV